MNPSQFDYSPLNLDFFNSTPHINSQISSQDIDCFFAETHEDNELRISSRTISDDFDPCLADFARQETIIEEENTPSISRIENPQATINSNFCLSNSNFKTKNQADKNTNKSKLRNSGAPKNWTTEHDQRLIEFGARYKGAWKKIAKRFSQKELITPLFLKNRFNELTSAPLQRRSKFQPSEDLMLAKYFEQYGPNWAQIATHFQNRTSIMLKNRYYAFIKKKDMMDFLIGKVRKLEEKEKIQDFGGEEHPLFGFEKEMSFCVTKTSSECLCLCSKVLIQDKGARAQEENVQKTCLMEQLKIFQSLYWNTKAELNELKAKWNISN